MENTTLFNKLVCLGYYTKRVSKNTGNALQADGLLSSLTSSSIFLISPTIAERLYVVKHNITSLPTCAACKTVPVKFITPAAGFRQFCSNKCRSGSQDVRAKTNATMVERYGVSNAFMMPGVSEKAITGTKTDSAKQKRKATCLKKYGVEFNSQAACVQDKKKATCLANYGVEYSVQAESVQQTIQETCRRRFNNKTFFGSSIGIETIKASFKSKYGVNNYMLTPEFHIQAKSTWLHKYGVDNPFKSTRVKDKIKVTHDNKYGGFFTRRHISADSSEQLANAKWLVQQHHILQKPLNQIADELGDVTHKTVWNYFKKMDIEIKRFARSLGEKEVVAFLREIGIRNIVLNDRAILKGKEIDIFLPDYNIGIEFNGLYWHSSEFKDKYFHVDKTLATLEANIHLIHIFEDEWASKREIVKSRLKSILGLNDRVYARKCDISEISAAAYKQFTNEWHIQGYAAAAVKYGLYYENELVAVMSFAKSRYTSDQFELIRFCSKDVNVVGGAGRLFKKFTTDHLPNKIVSYADRCWSMGALYHNLNFKNVTVDIRNVGYWYFIKGRRYHRSNFNKQALINLGCDSSLTEKTIMESAGALRIYNSGQLKFIWDSA